LPNSSSFLPLFVHCVSPKSL